MSEWKWVAKQGYLWAEVYRQKLLAIVTDATYTNMSLKSGVGLGDSLLQDRVEITLGCRRGFVLCLRVARDCPTPRPVVDGD